MWLEYSTATVPFFKKTMDRKNNEPYFGEKMAPILEELETAVWEHNVNFEGERPMYPDSAMRSAACIFVDVLMDRMSAEQERKDIPIGMRELQAETAGSVIRQIIMRFTGLDTHELMKECMNDE